MGCLRNGLLVGGPTVPLGCPKLAVFLESMTFSKGPASTEALCSTCGGIPVPCLGG